MEEKRKVMAGEVLTLSLLKRIDKAAYQFGGLDVVGKTSFKIHDGKAVRTKPTVLIPKKYIKGSVEKFVVDFEKTMNSLVFNIKII